MKKVIILLGISLWAHAHTVYIVIHGTWAHHAEWYQPDGEFFTTLEASARSCNAQLVPFSWSGKNSNNARKDAARRLAKLIQSYPLSTRICLVSHSHGTNVANLCSQLLANNPQNRHHIFACYALGTPVDIQIYNPNMDAIEYFYHMFSLKDHVQTVLGIYERQYPPHERIANLRITINGIEPTHSNLHNPIIGKWIPAIHHMFAHQKVGNFDQFDFATPGIIHFYDNQLPKYQKDSYRAQDYDRARIIDQGVHRAAHAYLYAKKRGRLNNQTASAAY